MASANLVVPRVDTPARDTSHRTGPSRLPDALVCEHLRRLAVCAAVGAGLWTYGLAMDTIVRPLTTGTAIAVPIVMLEVVAIAVSLAMFAYVRYAPHCHDWKTDAGLLFVVLNAAAVSLFNIWSGVPANQEGRSLSWNVVVILVGAMILPAKPRRMLAAAVMAASMDPLAIWIAHFWGAASGTFTSALLFSLPNFACAVVAMLPSHVLHGIGRSLRRAQEMGSYQLVEPLGRGGMGEVWRAKHRLLARSAAIKLVRPELLGAVTVAEAENMLGRFEQEAQATAGLSSPHTIQIFDFGITADQTFYYVMELLAGRDLQSLVREFGPVPAGRALFLLQQVCHSLAEAHLRGLVHRDVTPSNIYVCRMGLDYDFVKVLDFGLVKLNGRRSLEAKPTGLDGTTTGTPAFMAPEIILGAEIDQRADVYAIGCVAYYLLTGRPVFEADNPTDMFLLHLQATPVPPSHRTEMPISRQLDALVLECLQKDPRRRPRDAAAVLDMLRHCPTGEPWDHETARAWWERHLVELTVSPAAAGAASREPTLVTQ